MEHTDINHQGMGLMVSLLDESETMMQITDVINYSKLRRYSEFIDCVESYSSLNVMVTLLYRLAQYV